MEIDLKDGNQNLTVSYRMMLKAYIQNSSEKSLEKMSGYLNVVVGGPDIIDDNYCIINGIANGTGCVFAKVILNKNAIIKLRVLPATQIVVPSVLSSHVECIIMKHILERYKNISIDPSLSKGFFPIHPVK